METKLNAKKTITFALSALLFAGLCCVSSVLRPSGYTSAQGTTNITVYNNTDTSYCRVWFGDPSIGLRTYIFTRDQLGLFKQLKPEESLHIRDMYFDYGTYYLWLQECGTLIWDSHLKKGTICGPEKNIQVGVPSGPSATQTVMAYPIEPAPTPLIAHQITGGSSGLNGLYLHSSEASQWTESNTGIVHYVHTLLRFYDDGLVIGTYLDFEDIKESDYFRSEFVNDLIFFNRYNALGKPIEDGIYRGGVGNFYIAGTLYQRRLAYGRYYVEGNQIWFTLTNQECHHSTLTELEWEGSREYVGTIKDGILDLQTYSLRAPSGSELEIVISTDLYGHDHVSHIKGDFEIQRDTQAGYWDHIETGSEQIFHRIDIDLGDE